MKTKLLKRLRRRCEYYFDEKRMLWVDDGKQVRKFRSVREFMFDYIIDNMGIASLSSYHKRCNKRHYQNLKRKHNFK